MLLLIPETIKKNAKIIDRALVFFDGKVVEIHKNVLENTSLIVNDAVFDKCIDIHFEIFYADGKIWSFKAPNKECLIYNTKTNNSSDIIEKQIISFIPPWLIKRNENSSYENNSKSKSLIIDELAKKANSIKKTKKVKTGKNLVYYSLFDKGNDYIDLLSRSILSLNKSSLFQDILVITDENTKQKIKDGLHATNKNIIYHVIDTPADNIDASKAKTRIFDYENIDAYETILFLDADTFAIDSIDIIFHQQLDYNTLYTAYNKNLTANDHRKSLYHGFEMMDDGVFDQVVKNNQMPFNAGQFLFKNCTKMREHFKNVNWFMEVWPGEYFFEQAFMNYYFCSNLLTEPKTLDVFVKLVSVGSFSQPVNKELILHFIGPALNGKIKNEQIDRYRALHNLI
jgi:hypothetical protein